MLEAKKMGRPLEPVSFLTTEELYNEVLADVDDTGGAGEACTVYTASKAVLEEIRGCNINTSR